MTTVLVTIIVLLVLCLIFWDYLWTPPYLWAQPLEICVMRVILDAHKKKMSPYEYKEFLRHMLETMESTTFKEYVAKELGAAQPNS